ncbi:MAG TPA: serine hydrolase domain-containing protein, partial [Blastocatellia bacterium]
MTKLPIRLLGLLLAVCLLTPAQLQAQNGPAPAPLNGLDGFVEQVMKEWKVPGLAVAIVKDGKVVYAKGFGYRDVKREMKVTPDTLFAIGSCSKAFTATALAMLVDEGKL